MCMAHIYHPFVSLEPVGSSTADTDPPPLSPHPALVLRAFSRRIATDKFIQLFFVLNFGALLGIIVWYAVKKGKISPPKIVTPPPPSFTGSAAHVHIGPPLDIPEHARKYLR